MVQYTETTRVEKVRREVNEFFFLLGNLMTTFFEFL